MGLRHVCVSASGRHLRALSILALIFAVSLTAFPAISSASSTATKIYVSDGQGGGEYLEISNTGTINALARIFESPNLAEDVRVLAMNEILTGASAAGMLNSTQLVAGDLFYAIDDTSGDAIIVEFDGTNNILPSGCYGFTKFIHPGSL